jgi:hypothetical protein
MPFSIFEVPFSIALPPEADRILFRALGKAFSLLFPKTVV